MSEMPPPQPAPLPERILRLVQRFAQHKDTYKQQSYNETQVRREFIDPLFETLGWDVDNHAGHAEAYKDVIHEDAIKVGGSTKAPDYCFRIGGVRKFFVEAKKPSVAVKDDPAPAYQLRRYAWTAKLPLAIVTDFEEFAVYDCRIRPRQSDKPATARVKYITYEQYADQWEDIAAIFSKEAILQGSFDKYAESNRRKRGTAEVDTEFLKEIERWRELLARNIALRNPELSVRELNYAVSKTIDRLIFLRMCEDRGVETYAQLRILLNGSQVYDRLRDIFRRADDRYNSGLFYFQQEKDRPDAPDELTPGLIIDDGVLQDIIKGLYYPECPYEFSVLPAEILGQVYEQFLGKVIRLTKGHRAVVEEKPEVKKAGGVYYTPTYIVDYIVKHTVGKLLDGRTVKWIGKQNRKTVNRPSLDDPLRILDPACGSGSFLLGAYQYLLRWYLDYYTTNDPKAWATQSTPPIHESTNPQPAIGDSQSNYRLSIAERKRILLDHIFGVDIDAQAVEVTKLSLLLKVLEGESVQTLDHQLRLFHERALPDLAANIKCGNSLIGPDFYDNQQLPLLDDDERYRINVFDWHAEFPEVFTGAATHVPSRDRKKEADKATGFDAVIGNPPYIRIQTMRDTAPDTIDYYKRRYAAASKGNYDIYVLFVERGLSLLSNDGRLGMIVPHKFFNAKYGESLRRLCAAGQHLAHVVHFGDQQVFTGATTYTCLMFLNRAPHAECRVLKVEDLAAWRAGASAEEGLIRADTLSDSEWNFHIGAGIIVIDRMRRMPVRLADVANRIYQGPITSADTVYLFKDYKITEGCHTARVHSKALGEWLELEQSVLRSVVRSGAIGRYHATPTALVLFPYEVVNGTASLIHGDELESHFPLAWEYLRRNRRVLEDRERGRFKDSEWYRFGRPQNLGMWEQRKLMIPYMVTCLGAYLDDGDDHYFINVTTGGYGITTDESHGALPYMCGLLNSRLLDFLFKQASTTFHGGYFAANKQYVEQLPIRPIDFDNETDRSRHNRMVALVQQMLDLHKQLAAAKTPTDKTAIQRQIDATDRQIDQLVYELYALTDDEIAIVEEATHGQ